MDAPRPQDHQVVIGVGMFGDLVDEPLEVLEPMRLAGGLGSPATVANGRVVSNVSRAMVMGGHV